MYDPVETNLSEQYLEKVLDRCNVAVMGGWATFYHVNEEYEKAFGTTYLKSRDIDVYVTAENVDLLVAAINDLGFRKSRYPFRYEIIYDRLQERIVAEEAAEQVPLHRLFYIFLDVFSNEEFEILGSWVLSDGNVTTTTVDSVRVVDVPTLLNMKCNSFFDRDKMNKQYKDGCDIYALLNYSGHTIEKTEDLHMVVERILNREDLIEFIAENVLNDALKTGAVKATLQRFHSQQD